MRGVHTSRQVVDAATPAVLTGAPCPLRPNDGAALLSLYAMAWLASGADGGGEVRDGATDREGRLRAAAGALPSRRGPSLTATRRQVRSRN